MTEEEKKYYYDLGFPEGYYGLRLEIITDKDQEARAQYLMGYAAGKRLSSDMDDEAKKVFNNCRNEHIKLMGYKAGYMNYEVSCKNLNEREQDIFNQGLSLGKQQRVLEDDANKSFERIKVRK